MACKQWAGSGKARASGEEPTGKEAADSVDQHSKPGLQISNQARTRPALTGQKRNEIKFIL